MSYLPRINQKLDEGWNLTTFSCQCKSNYLINMATKELYCPKCDIYTKTEIKIEKENSDDFNDDLNEDDSDTQVNSNSKEQNQQTKITNLHSRDEVSKEIGKLLLSGWKMLGDSCKVCYQPLMQKGQGDKYCVGCKKAHTKTKQEEPQRKQPQIQPVIESVKKEQIIEDEQVDDQLQIDEESRKLFQMSSQKEEAAKQIAKYLTQGWIMMENSCQKCLQPIMKDKGGKQYCVGCKEYIGQQQQKKVNNKNEQNIIQEPKKVQQQQEIKQNNFSYNNRIQFERQIIKDLFEALFNELSSELDLDNLKEIISQIKLIDVVFDQELQSLNQKAIKQLTDIHKNQLLKKKYQQSQSTLKLIQILLNRI